jgi:hypothetical protein
MVTCSGCRERFIPANFAVPAVHVLLPRNSVAKYQSESDACDLD